ncbi:MAG: ribosome small subunit-dependent GTPase A [Bacteriovoracaceae bacterium]|nr:ribosome small subunit-dependent GTPase A [Bacteriovoracaceae bacterium]
MRARIYRSAKREFDCKVESTGEIVQAKALGNLLKGKRSLVVGDYVEIIDENGELVITEMEDRTSEVFRILVREQKRKVISSNCDLMVILISVSRPTFKRGIIDRFLVRASQWGIRPVVVFNKMDEYDPEEFDICFEQDRLKALGVDCFECTALDKEYVPKYLEKGYGELVEALRDRTAIFLGQSGVGKSKTINALAGGEIKVELKTNIIGKSNKGSHTTTWAEMLDLDLFTLIDSPGVRSFSLQDIMSDNFIEYFPDLEEMSTHCKFNNCTHKEGVKGCAFYLIEDEYQAKLLFSRLQSYWRILEELEVTPDWQKK